MPYIKARICKKQGGIIIHAALPLKKYVLSEHLRLSRLCLFRLLGRLFALAQLHQNPDGAAVS